MSSFILICIYILLGLSNCDKLIFTSIHFRHGARAPMKVDEEYKDHAREKWVNPGELTGIGQRMLYVLGLRNRLRYITDTHFLSEKFDSHEILIYSTPFNRTLLSAYALLQGLYPESDELGERLTEVQEQLAVPDIKYNYPSIEEKLKKIKGAAMPNFMTLIPVRMINNNEKKMTLYDIGECEEVRDKIKENNRKTLPIIINMEKEFNERFGEKLNKFYGEKQKYDYLFMNRFCDAVVSGITDGRNLNEFKEKVVDPISIKNYCYEVQTLNYREHILGDKEHILAPLEASKLMREIIYYMIKRIDIDIKQIRIEENYLDYSNPKMFMISGHDSTIACHEMFILDCLKLDIEKNFKLPKYGGQFALEITRRDAPIDLVKKMTYKDYFVNYYFNDELIFKINVDEFIKKIEPKLWTDKQIDDFCGFNKNNNNNKNFNNNIKTNINNINLIENQSIVLMSGSILLALFLIFLTTTIILCVKLSRMNKPVIKQETNIAMVDLRNFNE